MNKQNTGHFAAFPMLMSAFDQEELFLPKEDVYAYMLYYILSMQSHHSLWWGSVETTIVTLSKQLPIKTISNKKKESDNKREIKRLLLSLHNKGYVDIAYQEDSLEYDTLLTISVPDGNSIDAKKEAESYLQKKGKSLKHVGFVRINEEVYKACAGNPWHLRILIYAMWREQIDYRICTEEWAKVLGTCENTAVKYLKEVDQLNLVNKISGSYYVDGNNSPRRLPNQYRVLNPEVREERNKLLNEEFDEQKLTKQINIETNLEKSIQNDVQDPRAANTNLLNTGFLTGNCWYVWNTTEYSATKQIGDNRFNALKEKNPMAYKRIEKEGKKIKRQYENRKYHQYMARTTSGSYMNDDDPSRESIYKKKPVKDFAAILD